MVDAYRRGEFPPPEESDTIGDSLEKSIQIIDPLSDTAPLDAQVLLAHIVDKDRPWLLAHEEHRLTENQHVALDQALNLLVDGIPLPYVVGKWEFYGQSFGITPEVLIPRPETELLVETAIKWLNANPGRLIAADVGTGCGCIAVSLAIQKEGIQITATDISLRALGVAQQNAANYRVEENITFLENDLLYDLAGPFDLICANLPYIPSRTLMGLEVFGREPLIALDGGPDGLTHIERLLNDLPRILAARGLALLEIEAGQGEAVQTLARKALPRADIRVRRDLAGKPRLLVVESA